MKTKPYIKSGKDATYKMMQQLDITKPIKVYFNLHKKCLSVQQGGIVKFHAEYICMRDVKCKVSEAGRQRVLKEKRKNVHAYLIGYITCPTVIDDMAKFSGKLKYNPYKYSSFVDEYENPVYDIDFVDIMSDSRNRADINTFSR